MFTINLIENIEFDQHEIADEFIYQGDEIALKTIAKTISESSNITSMSCQIGHLSTATLKLQPIEWWRQNGCHIKTDDRLVWYVVEQVSGDDCGLTSENRRVHVSYVRLTLKSDQRLMLLQANFIQYSPIVQSCENIPYKVSTGLLNQYFL